ncbi:hypothetical protein LguiA_028179 [Lonicera macranthoides]
MTLKGGTSQACAACKYQRRKCTPDCALAPYFPPDQPKMFQNAHKLFGVSNILKILKQLDRPQKMIAMQSIIYQSNIRDRFPVHGCLGIICQLRYQIHQAEEELHAVHTQLALYRHHDIASIPNDTNAQLTNVAQSNDNALNLFQETTTYNPVPALPINSHHSYANSGYVESKDNNLINSMWVQPQQAYYDRDDNNNNNDNTMAIQSQLISSTQQMTLQDEMVQEYEEIHPFFDTIDDRQSYIESKEAYESSSESSLKDTSQSLELTLLRAN